MKAITCDVCGEVLTRAQLDEGAGKGWTNVCQLPISKALGPDTVPLDLCELCSTRVMNALVPPPKKSA